MSFSNDQQEPSSHVGIGRTNFSNADILDHNNSDCSESKQYTVESKAERILDKNQVGTLAVNVQIYF